MPKVVGGNGFSWLAIQGNGTVVAMQLDQDMNGDLSGFASHGSAAHPESVPAAVNGVHGQVTDTDFHLTIKWSDGPKGQYDGHFAGVTFNVDNIQEQTTWVSDTNFG
jgi:hypothetical protein